jgi:hypothetical protein
MPHPLFHPVNPVNPVKIQFFNCIVPAKNNRICSGIIQERPEARQAGAGFNFFYFRFG